MLVPFPNRFAEQAPAPEDVTAGGWGGLVLVLLVVAVALLMLSFLKQMRRADQAKREGVYGDEPARGPAPDPTRPPPAEEG